MPVKGSTKKTNRPEAKARVIRRRMRGETTRQIAAAEGIARNTVIRILSLPEVQQAVARSRSLIIERADELAEKLVQVALGKTGKGDRADRQALVDILRGIGVLTAKLELATSDVPERDYADTKVKYYYEHGKWPTKQEAIEFDKTLPIEPLFKGELE
jgi:hypothetical protein